MAHFDLIIVGTGVAGRTAAEDAAAAGLRTALIDEREFGGTCALRGCEPKRVLSAAAEVVHRVNAQRAAGVSGAATLDWSALVAFKRTFTDSLPAAFEHSFTDMGVTPLHGVATFESPTTMRVGDTTHEAETFLVATGAMPAPLGIPGVDLVIDSERFMEMDRMPSRVVFIGGGYVSFELAAIAAAAGAEAVILHRGSRPLEQFDADLVGMLVSGYREMGLDVRLGSPVLAVEAGASGLVVRLADGSALKADLVVHGAGRVPRLAELDLATGGVSFGGSGIEVDRHMRSVSNEHVFAAGDAAALGAPLTPVGVAQARVAVRNMIEPGSAVFDPSVVPSIVFSDPPLASVGLSEQDARERGLDVDVRLTDTSAWASARRVGLRHAGAKTIVERSGGRVLGAHVLGHNAEELVNLFALAIAQGVTARQLKDILWGYPTTTSEIVYMV